MLFYYSNPTMVKYLDERLLDDGDSPLGGIAYQDEVICMYSGITIPCNEIVELTELPWVRLSDKVLGRR